MVTIIIRFGSSWPKPEPQLELGLGSGLELELELGSELGSVFRFKRARVRVWARVMMC